MGFRLKENMCLNFQKINSDIDVIHKDYTPIPKGQRNEHTEIKVRTPSVLELVIGDSKFAWSKAMELYLDIISAKQYQDVEFILINYDNVRPAGEILKTFGGRSSGYTAIKSDV